MVGTSRDAPLRVVERLAVRADRLPGVLDELRIAGCLESVVLSTCGRTECYAVFAGPGRPGKLLDVMLATAGPDARAMRAATVQRSGPEVATHLFRLAAGLESRVAGEVEIQGQVRSAARGADTQGTLGPHLRALFGAAVATARRAHRMTGLAALGRSIGRIGIDAALEASSGGGRRVAIVGTGRMASVALGRLTELDIMPLVYGRTIERTELLTGGGVGYGIDELPRALRDAGLVVCATSAQGYLVTAGVLAAAMADRRGQPLTLLDLSVPRNVDPAARAVNGIRLIDLEDLGRVGPVPERVALDEVLAQAADVVADGLRRFADKGRASSAGPVIARLQDHAEDAYRSSLRQLRPDLVANGTADRLARAMSRRVVHGQLHELRAAAKREDSATIEQIIRRVVQRPLNLSALPPPPA